jgi:hypothetical protein
MISCPVALRLTVLTALLALDAPGADAGALAPALSGMAAAHDSTRASGRDASKERRKRDEGRREYLADVLRQRDYVVERWADRKGKPIRVWISAPSRKVSAWDDDFPAAVRSAFAEWQDRRLPVRFTFVNDSASAEVRVRWVSRFSTDESGRTVWWSNQRSMITRAEVTLSTHASDGGAQDPISLRAVALHEVGHLLGLDHCSEASNVMAPWVQVSSLSAADRETARRLYQMPLGKVK